MPLVEMPPVRSPADRPSTSGEIRLAAEDALRNAGYAPVAELHCEVIDDLLLLTGELPSYYLKQIAQEAILRTGAASQVRNLVSVAYRDDDD